jgi:hypothetical protein
MLVIPNKAQSIWSDFLKQNKVLVHKYVVREIKKAYTVGNSDADLFKFEDGKFHTKVPRKNFVKTLHDAKELFIKEQEFEYAGEVSKLINTIVIEDLIKDTLTKEE